MSYVINGKVYTNNSMLDEIVYNTKLILDGIVVKNQYVADLYETNDTVQKAEYYSMCIDGSMTYNLFPFTSEILENYGYSEQESLIILNDRNKVPEKDREDLLEFSINYYITTFIEENKYYRSLIGLPEYNTTEFDYYITPSDLPNDYDKDSIDYALPIHEQPNVVILAMKSSGRLDEIIEKNRSFNYSYLRFLGDTKLNLYKVRKAGKWDILYIPDVNATVSSRFQELYGLNKEIYLRRFYQEAYAFNSDYYDHCMILMLLSQTFNDMIVDTPEWLIRRDIFDIRTVQNFLESYGVTFFEEIPLKYQIRIVKSLNKLIKYKSSEENFKDILEIFSLKGTDIYKYFLYKKRKVDEYGHYIESDDLNEMYELQFIEVKLGDTYDNYIKNLVYRTPYDEITEADEYWDGVEDHETVKQQILEREFTIEPSKYMTIKADIDFNNYQRQIRYFMSLLLDSRVNLEDITVSVPSIAESTSFSITNLFLFLIISTDLYYNTNLNIIKPEDAKEPYEYEHEDFTPSYKLNEWWMKERYPEAFITYDNRVYGFNPEANYEEVKEVIERNFTNFRFTNYTLADFGVEGYKELPDKISTFDELLTLYENNIKCYDNLNKILCYRCDTKDKGILGNYIFKEFFTKKYDYGFGDGYTTLDQVLKSRDYTLWSFYKRLTQMSDKDTMKNDIESVMNEILNNLEYYLSRDSLDYLFSFTPVASFSAVLSYIYLMVNIFKSYKTHFIEPTTKHVIGYPDISMDNLSETRDTIFSHTSFYKKYDKQFINEQIAKIVIKHITDSIERLNFIEILDIFTKFDADPDDNYDYDGMTALEASDDYKNADGGTATLDVPYINLDGGKSYGVALDWWNIDGKFPATNQVYDLDGGNTIQNENDEWNVSDDFVTKFNNIIEGRGIEDDKFVNNNFFLRVTDDQSDKLDVKVSVRTGLKYTESKDKKVIYLTEFWRQWMSINDFESYNDIATLANLYSDVNIDIWDFLDDDADPSEYAEYISDKITKHNMYNLDNKFNNGPDIQIKDVYIDGISVEVDDDFSWDFGDEDEAPSTDEIDKNFGDLDDGESPNVYTDIEFGELPYSSDIILIEDMGNKDTARIITITA